MTNSLATSKHAQRSHRSKLAALTTMLITGGILVAGGGSQAAFAADDPATLDLANFAGVCSIGERDKNGGDIGPIISWEGDLSGSNLPEGSDFTLTYDVTGPTPAVPESATYPTSLLNPTLRLQNRVYGEFSDGTYNFTITATSGAATDSISFQVVCDNTQEPVTPAPPVTPEQPAAAPAIQLSSASVAAGDSITITASGFTPGERLESWLHSTPVLLASATADANGALVQTVQIPTNTVAGSHQIEVRGANGATVSADIQVARQLATTGLDSTAMLPIALGAGALLLGGVAIRSIGSTRRRRIA